MKFISKSALILILVSGALYKHTDASNLATIYTSYEGNHQFLQPSYKGFFNSQSKIAAFKQAMIEAAVNGSDQYFVTGVYKERLNHHYETVLGSHYNHDIVSTTQSLIFIPAEYFRSNPELFTGLEMGSLTPDYSRTLWQSIDPQHPYRDGQGNQFPRSGELLGIYPLRVDSQGNLIEGIVVVSTECGNLMDGHFLYEAEPEPEPKPEPKPEPEKKPKVITSSEAAGISIQANPTNYNYIYMPAQQAPQVIVEKGNEGLAVAGGALVGGVVGYFIGRATAPQQQIIYASNGGGYWGNGGHHGGGGNPYPHTIYNNDPLNPGGGTITPTGGHHYNTTTLNPIDIPGGNFQNGYQGGSLLGGRQGAVQYVRNQQRSMYYQQASGQRAVRYVVQRNSSPVRQGFGRFHR